MNYPASEDFPILEHLAACAGCVYLSDLRFLSTCQRRHLAAEVAAIPCRAASLHCWNDALFYLTGIAGLPGSRPVTAHCCAGRADRSARRLLTFSFRFSSLFCGCF